MAESGRPRVLSMLLLICLVGCTSHVSGSEPASVRATPRLVPNAPSSVANGGSASLIPVTPPLKFVGTDSKGMALEASAAIAAGGNMRTAAVVASLAASGVPVIGPDGIPVAGTGNDSVGVPWWVAETSPYGMQARYSISSLIQLMQQSLPTPKNPLTTEISDLMTKLRGAAVVDFATSDVQTSFS
jgi:hypothetical protein